MSNNGFLINEVPGGGTISSTAEFDVRNYAKRLVLAGAENGDVVQLQVLAGLNEVTGTWADLCYNGTSIQLTNTNNQYEIIVEGHYRVTFEGSSTTLQVWMEEDTIGLDQRTLSIFAAPAVITNSFPDTVSGDLAVGGSLTVAADSDVTGDATVGGKILATGGLGVGNSAAATTLGTVTKKIEVFNAAGASLGFLAVYDAIT